MLSYEADQPYNQQTASLSISVNSIPYSLFRHICPEVYILASQKKITPPPLKFLSFLWILSIGLSLFWPNKHLIVYKKLCPPCWRDANTAGAEDVLLFQFILFVDGGKAWIMGKICTATRGIFQ